MKNSIRLAVVATVIGVGSISALADQTNLVRNLDIQLSGIVQGDTTTTKNVTTTSVTKVSVGNSDIIGAIGIVTGNSFSSNAKLLVITPVPVGGSSIVIRDGGNQVDVTQFFVQSFLTQQIGKSTVNSKTGKASGSNYSLQEFSFVDAGGYDPVAFHYSVSGVATENFSIPAIPGPRSELKADVSGAGDLNGELLLLQGSIKVSGQAVEVVVGGGGPPPV